MRTVLSPETVNPAQERIAIELARQGIPIDSSDIPQLTRIVSKSLLLDVDARLVFIERLVGSGGASQYLLGEQRGLRTIREILEATSLH